MGGLLKVPVVSIKQQGTSASSLGHQQEMASGGGCFLQINSSANQFPLLSNGDSNGSASQGYYED